MAQVVGDKAICKQTRATWYHEKVYVYEEDKSRTMTHQPARLWCGWREKLV